jgi:hypothetical protein
MRSEKSTGLGNRGKLPTVLVRIVSMQRKEWWRAGNEGSYFCSLKEFNKKGKRN